MDGQELKILFNHDKAYLTPDHPMTFEQIGLPEIAKKGFKSPAYWKFIVKRYLSTSVKYSVRYYRIIQGKRNLKVTRKRFLASSIP